MRYINLLSTLTINIGNCGCIVKYIVYCCYDIPSQSSCVHVCSNRSFRSARTICRLNYTPVRELHDTCFPLEYTCSQKTCRPFSSVRLLRTCFSCCNCRFIIQHYQAGLVAWHSGRTSVSDWRTFPVLRSTCS